MEELIIFGVFVLYVGNIILARKLNRVLYKMDDDFYALPKFWFIPIVPIIVFLIVISGVKWNLGERIDGIVNKFNGYNW